MTEQESNNLWESYFYPDTDVLINKLNIKDYNQLKKIEATHNPYI